MNDSYKPKILIVDDEPMVTRTLQGVLRMDGGMECTAVNRPAEGLELLGKESFDVILSDFIMPELDGLEFLSRARELQPEASRILLTGYADKESAIRSINEIGLYQYIEKPWHNQQLLMLLRNAAERTCLLRRLNNSAGADGELRQQIWKMLI
jgi:DNA-binding NtrC family response regulator